MIISLGVSKSSVLNSFNIFVGMPNNFIWFNAIKSVGVVGKDRWFHQYSVQDNVKAVI